MTDIRFNFGGPIATAFPAQSPHLVLAWDLLGGEIEAVAHDRPLGKVGSAKTARAFRAFATDFIDRAMRED